MREKSSKDEGTDHLDDPTLKEEERAPGRGGKEAHGGDLAPPNKDDAGRVIAPEKGEPETH